MWIGTNHSPVHRRTTRDTAEVKELSQCHRENTSTSGAHARNFTSNVDLWKGFVHCSVFYPDSVEETEQFNCILISVLTVKWKKNMIQCCYCEVFTASLSSLVAPTDKIVTEAI